MESHEKLLLENKAWAQEISQYNPKYFERLAKSQSPEFLWMGCSDSRVPANEITNTQPGEMFVHRNIANQVPADDINVLSVVQYAVEVLKVPHVIVCGHYGCGGVQAALTDQKFGLLDHWLEHIRKVNRANKDELNTCKTEEEKLNLAVEINVKQQVINLMHSDSIQKMWKKSPYPVLHGWVYGLRDGIIKEIVMLTKESIHHTDF